MESINQEIENLIAKYEKVSASDLLAKYKIESSAKNVHNMLTTKIIQNELPELIYFIEKEKASVKTIRLDRFDGLRESMSLPTFKYCDLVKEEWNTSKLRTYFYDTPFVFFTFKEDNKNYYLWNIAIWKMPLTILDSDVRDTWQTVKNLLLDGKIVKYIDDNNRYFTYFPASTDTAYVHVRPHAQNRNDTYPLPVPDLLTGMTSYPKHSFWLNRAYIQKIITKENRK